MHRWEISNQGNRTEEAEQVARMMEAAAGEVDSSMEDSDECIVDHMNFGAEMDAEPSVPCENDDDSSAKDDDDLELLRALRHHQYEDFGGNDSLNSDVAILKDNKEEEESDESDEENHSDDTEEAVLDQDHAPPIEPNRTMRDNFRAYCETHKHDFLNLSKQDKTQIRLLSILKDKKTHMNAYGDVLEWHLKEKGVLQENDRLGDAHGYQGRKTLLARLSTRYNLDAMKIKKEKIRLPSSKAVVTIPCCDAKDCIVSLLTDPRMRDEDYLFFDDDPMAPPPDKIPVLKDLNTGEAYLQSYEKLITKANQVLLPVIMYIDGAVTGTFSDLPITALKISLGIHCRQARDKEKCWRELGFVPQVCKETSRGKKIFRESGHLESQNVVVLDGEGSSSSEEDTDSQDEDAKNDEDHEEPVKAQDFHSMLSVILESFVELQRTGFYWDLVYKGILYQNIEFVPFVAFVKCDTEEADLLCGKYLCRNEHVKHICRYCHCPMSLADDPRARYPMKTQPEIQNLIEKQKLHQLQQISQQYIQNAWYRVRFHVANDRGIHRACPSEKLHAILLGLFKYIRSIFFKFCGESSKLADEINGLARLYGSLFRRQSDRDLPNTNFAKGILKGKLMATEYRGVLLVMAAVLRSTEGRRMLATRKRFGLQNGLDDWTLLVELMLEWESYLSLESMQKKHVKRLGRKHKYLMYIIRNVAKRTTGMGLKLMKFHAVLHMIQDMLLYGTPSEFDTGSNESHHKPSKYAAKLTQRNESTFNYQTALRLLEFLIIEFAKVETEYEIKAWEYFDFVEEVWDPLDEATNHSTMETDMEAGSEEEGPSESDHDAVPTETRTGGTRIEVYEDEDMDDEPSFRILGRSAAALGKTKWSSDVVEFLNELQNMIVDNTVNKKLAIFTEHKRGDVIFRGHPKYRDRPWNDWAIMDWGDYGTLPCHIWCFVTLNQMPIGTRKLQFGGIDLKDGVFAVVESSTYDANIARASDLFIPLTLDVKGVDGEGNVTGREFFLADVESIVGPCIVVPDVGGPKHAYFQVKARRDWAKEFVTWLEQPHQDDEMVWSDEEEDAKD